jgi:transcriptional regulator with PAS, ATPase and Fis domain
VSTLANVASLALEVASLRGRGERSRLVEEAEPLSDLPGFIAASGAMRRLRAELASLAASRATVIVQGESGSGKEVIARSLHELSLRAREAFVAFNCAAIPRDLFEGQLFGYRRGAFTGAVTDHPGVIRAADHGTLFLDEVGELPLDTQPKLLRFLENGEVFPLGERRPIKVDVRIVAATHKDLASLVREGRFREDLYYRLQVVPLRVPPLRERREDIVALARYFVRALTSEGHEAPALSTDALAALVAHAWPGNVRELRNVIERVLAYSPVPRTITRAHLRIADSG